MWELPSCVLYYCSVHQCQKLHFTRGFHAKRCPILKYVHKDFAYLLEKLLCRGSTTARSGPDWDDSFLLNVTFSLRELARLLASIYRFRVAANKHFAAQEWKKSAELFEKAISLMKESRAEGIALVDT